MFGLKSGNFVAVCLAAVLLFSSCSAEEPKKKTRIVNGSIIHISQAPYIVQLRFIYGGPFCGGTLVSPQYVVSAAHCFDSMPYTSVVVVGGANTRTDPGVQRKIAAIRIPRQYTKERMDGDVAVLKLESPMSGSYIRPVNLCSAPLPPASVVQISGWGHTVSGGVGSHELRTIRIPTISRQQCAPMYSVPMTQNMLCAYSRDQDSCQGDSGGPAIHRNELCGVVSYGAGCAAGVPGVYSDVYSLRSYIEQAMRDMQYE